VRVVAIPSNTPKSATDLRTAQVDGITGSTILRVSFPFGAASGVVAGALATGGVGLLLRE
jgi:hypothetical protein